MRLTRGPLAPIVVAAALLLAGCGTAEPPAGSPSTTSAQSTRPESPAPVSTQPTAEPVPQTTADLTVTVTDADGRHSYRLTCPPAGSDHPRAEAACAQLDRAGPSALAPAPSGQVCTQVYGGPHTATVTGIFGVDRVDARFARTDGCEIDRWDALDEVLGHYDG